MADQAPPAHVLISGQGRDTVGPGSGIVSRIVELDALRGIAAMTVVFHHCLLVFPLFWAIDQMDLSVGSKWAALALSPVHLGWDGIEAVDLFFVLSGAVLAFPFLGTRPPEYLDFVRKRIIRIYLPYLFVMLIAVIMVHYLYPMGHPPGSSWFYRYWGRDVDVFTLLDNFLMLGGATSNYVNPVIWSLVHEMRISILFPGIMWLVSTQRPVKLLTAALLLSGGAKCVLHFGGSSHWWSTIVETVEYLFFFFAGAEISRFRDYLAAVYERMANWLRAVSFAAALVLFNARWESPRGFREVGAFCVWAGAVLIVALVLASSGKGSVLRIRPLVWLGQISYSLYLTHCIVLFTALFVVQSRLPMPLVVALVPLISLCVAAAAYRAVELPSIRLARGSRRRVGHALV